ncbi:choline/ethanolamine kinase-like [Oppia nitens]|uniref:choline/ethanolamine kinase-like n=1 Tax=Oppia nitens TaxID=1686743 RepID=UPI0023DCD0AE|nr:choline/ethanolamine kinase-like [Oppia nitens]
MSSDKNNTTSSTTTTPERKYKNLKDFETYEEFDMRLIEQIRGETPADINDKCLQLCKDYLAGDWLNQTLDTIEVTRISGGFSNQLYRCAISNPINLDKPHEVAVRLYQSKWFNTENSGGFERLNDIVVEILISQHKLGPKVLGLFDGGEIQLFYKHKLLHIEEQSNPQYSEQLFRAIARVHALDAPLKKQHWIHNELSNVWEQAKQQFPSDQLLDECDCQTLKTHDLGQEVHWLNKTIEELNCPMVFSHNDFVHSNIMILDTPDDSGNRIMLCDYEYASYGYRGQDLGTIICEWGHPWNDMKSFHNFIDDSLIEQFLRHYIDENVSIFGDKYLENENNSLNQLMKESKLFALVFKMTLILWSVKGGDETDGFSLDNKIAVKLFNKYQI